MADEQGSARNVAFYRRLLHQYPWMVGRSSPLAWLRRQPLGRLLGGPFTLPAAMRR